MGIYDKILVFQAESQQVGDYFDGLDHLSKQTNVQEELPLKQTEQHKAVADSQNGATTSFDEKIDGSTDFLLSQNELFEILLGHGQETKPRIGDTADAGGPVAQLPAIRSEKPIWDLFGLAEATTITKLDIQKSDCENNTYPELERLEPNLHIRRNNDQVQEEEEDNKHVILGTRPVNASSLPAPGASSDNADESKDFSNHEVTYVYPAEDIAALLQRAAASAQKQAGSAPVPVVAIILGDPGLQQLALPAARPATDQPLSGRGMGQVQAKLKEVLQKRKLEADHDVAKPQPKRRKTDNQGSPPAKTQDRKLRRRQQCREAARRFREKHRTTVDTLTKKMESLKDANTKLRTEISLLNQRKAELKKLRDAHLMVCPQVKTSPEKQLDNLLQGLGLSPTNHQDVWVEVGHQEQMTVDMQATSQAVRAEISDYQNPLFNMIDLSAFSENVPGNPQLAADPPPCTHREISPRIPKLDEFSDVLLSAGLSAIVPADFPLADEDLADYTFSADVSIDLGEE
nr:hypothetical protein BaRGS_035137 [Batillaria attramentaria]